MRALLSAAALSMLFVAGLTASGADVLVPLDVVDVKVGGEIGWRIDATITNNLLKIDADGIFWPRSRSPARPVTATSAWAN